MRIALLIFLFINLFSTKVFANIYTQYSLGYNSDSSTLSSSTFSYTRMQNMLYIGAGVGTLQKWILGWNFYMWNRDNKAGSAGTTEKVALMELGPRVTYFFNLERNFYLSAAYHPYVTGTITGTQSEDVSGSGYLASMGYHHKASRTVYFGASINYQSTALATSTVASTETKVSYKYNLIYPFIELSIRFR